jgi:hypothetical protein
MKILIYEMKWQIYENPLNLNNPTKNKYISNLHFLEKEKAEEFFHLVSTRK